MSKIYHRACCASGVMLVLAVIVGLKAYLGGSRPVALPRGRSVTRGVFCASPRAVGSAISGRAARCYLPRDHEELVAHSEHLGLGRPRTLWEDAAMRLRLLAPVRADVEQIRDAGESLDEVVARMRYGESLEAHFPLGVPPLDVRMRSCGRGFGGLQQLSLVVERLRAVDSELDWSYVVGKYLVHCDPPDGLLVPHPDGFYEVLCSVEARGARAVLLKPVEGEGLEPIVLYPGTRRPWTVKRGGWTWWANLSAQIGSDSMERILPDLLPYLRDPERGFIASEGDRHAVLGMSLGGALAQSHAYALSSLGGLVSRATLVCPTGVAQPMIDAFAQLAEPPALTYITEYDDCTPELGDGHLGLGCEYGAVEIDYIMIRVGEDLPEAFPGRPAVARGLLRALYQLFVRGLGNAHVRDSLSEPHLVYHLSTASMSGHDQIQETLAHERPNTLERWRRRIGHGDDSSLVVRGQVLQTRPTRGGPQSDAPPSSA